MSNLILGSTEKYPHKSLDQRTFYKTWYFRLTDAISQRALRIRFSVLSSTNGFKRVAETWAVYFERQPNRDVKKERLNKLTTSRLF